MSTAGAPRHSCSVSATRERSISRRARNWLSGGSSIARSSISSIIVPPAAEDDHRAERVVRLESHAHLAAAPCTGHVLHRDAVDAGARLQALHAFDHVGVGVARRGAAGNVQRHPLHVRLVADVGRIDLQRHRKSQLRGDHHRLVRASRQHRLSHRDVEGREQRLRLHLGEHLAPLGQHALDDQARPLDVGLGQGGQRRRRLLQQQLVLVERGDVAEGADRRLGRAKARNRGLVQHTASPRPPTPRPSSMPAPACRSTCAPRPPPAQSPWRPRRAWANEWPARRRPACPGVPLRWRRA